MLCNDFTRDDSTGKRVYTRYHTYRDDYGNVCHRWVDMYERGQDNLIISNRGNSHGCCLAASKSANSKGRVGLGEVSTMTFYQYSHLRSDAAIGSIIAELDKQFGPPFEKVIQTAWEFWVAWYCIPPGTPRS